MLSTDLTRHAETKHGGQGKAGRKEDINVFFALALLTAVCCNVNLCEQRGHDIAKLDIS